MTGGDINIATEEFFNRDGRFHNDKYLKLLHERSVADYDMDVDTDDNEEDGYGAAEKNDSDDDTEDSYGGNPYASSQDFMPPPMPLVGTMVPSLETLAEDYE